MLFFSGGSFNAQNIRTNNNILQIVSYEGGAATNNTDSGNINVGQSQFIACGVRGIGLVEMWTNNSSDGANVYQSTSADGNYPIPVVGGYNATAYQWYGHMQEIIVFALNPSTNTTYRNDVSTALNSYYTTY
jgi:hypothetical protein